MPLLSSSGHLQNKCLVNKDQEIDRKQNTGDLKLQHELSIMLHLHYCSSIMPC